VPFRCTAERGSGILMLPATRSRGPSARLRRQVPKGFEAVETVTIDAPAAEVWDALGGRIGRSTCRHPQDGVKR